MTNLERLVVKRFPEHEKAIRTLSESSSRFSRLCRQYGEVTRKLWRLERASSPYVKVEAEMLSRRCAALESELIAMMRQNRYA